MLWNVPKFLCPDWMHIQCSEQQRVAPNKLHQDYSQAQLNNASWTKCDIQQLLFFMSRLQPKYDQRDLSKLDQIWQWMQLNQGSYHYVLYMKYWNFQRMPIYVQPNTKWMQLCEQKYFSNGVSIWRLFLWHSLLYFRSWVFFQLEAKYTQLPDDLKQCNRSYISMTNPTCIKTDISKI